MVRGRWTEAGEIWGAGTEIRAGVAGTGGNLGGAGSRCAEGLSAARAGGGWRATARPEEAKRRFDSNGISIFYYIYYLFFSLCLEFGTIEIRKRREGRARRRPGPVRVAHVPVGWGVVAAAAREGEHVVPGPRVPRPVGPTNVGPRGQVSPTVQARGPRVSDWFRRRKRAWAQVPVGSVRPRVTRSPGGQITPCSLAGGDRRSRGRQRWSLGGFLRGLQFHGWSCNLQVRGDQNIPRYTGSLFPRPGHG
ncbi:hypothetical protein PAHAL_8G248300 [Panicum hallii]|uniref:Uncharacterized protein n=1 Tax=Panicum hallii TaxID=206008 RepID=A0A2T8IA73_9POAL|nr:hypothetical protein PAHAL_8G248300 [Panicum hallii]PVH34560.1 hypothetical protein PAHAL_8G248300 [Panicum hallii]PVH34561.1 hypothetical protein PAHAL_8G248300 [Panicum hallii]